MKTRLWRGLWGVIAIFGAAMTVTGCQFPIQQYKFEPKLNEVIVRETPDQLNEVMQPEEAARALVSLLEIARPEGVYELRARLRVENTSKQPLTVRTDEMVLVSGDLQSFGAPRVHPRPNPTVVAGANETIELAFPFPPDQDPESVDLTTLNLQWMIESGEDRVPVRMVFNGEPVLYYNGPYYNGFYYYDGFGPYHRPFARGGFGADWCF